MDKATVWLIRFNFEVIIFGGIFGALWRPFLCKNNERQERERRIDEQIYTIMDSCYLENKNNDD